MQQHTQDYKDIFDQLPGFIVGMDLAGHYMFANHAFTSILGLKNKEQIFGLAFHNAPSSISEYADIHIQQNQEIFAGDLPVKLFDIHPYANNEILNLLVSKAPFKSASTHQLGIIANATAITQSLLLKISMSFAISDKRYRHKRNTNQRSYIISDQFYGKKLSARELECMFYLIRGKTIPDIANILLLSKRTVESYFENIKAKLLCNTKSDLIEKAVDTGLIDFIPESIFKRRIKHISEIIGD